MVDFEYSVTNLFENVSDTDSSLLRIKSGSEVDIFVKVLMSEIS